MFLFGQRKLYLELFVFWLAYSVTLKELQSFQISIRSKTPIKGLTVYLTTEAHLISATDTSVLDAKPLLVSQFYFL